MVIALQLPELISRCCTSTSCTWHTCAQLRVTPLEWARGRLGDRRGDTALHAKVTQTFVITVNKTTNPPHSKLILVVVQVVVGPLFTLRKSYGPDLEIYPRVTPRP